LHYFWLWEGGIGYGKAIFFNWTDTEPELGFGGLSVFGAMSLQLAFAVIPEDLRKAYEQGVEDTDGAAGFHR